jgi:nucleoside phosphorylase
MNICPICLSTYLVFRGEASISPIPDICTDLQQHNGQGKALVLLIQKYGLFGTWAGTASSGTGPSTKESLDQLIKNGAFKPLDLEMLAHGASSAKFGTKDKRTLAVKLGYCLMDFFDADLDSKKIYFLDSSKSDPKKEFPYLALGSKLPAMAESYSFQMGHPVLLSFAKILLEIDFGQSLELDIGPHNNQNRAAWVQLLGYVDRLEEDRNDSYLEAIRGCLIVHHSIAKRLRSCDLDSNDADSRVREALFENVVHKLELGLAESIPRASRKRQRSGSPPTSDRRDRAQAGNSRERQRSESPSTSDGEDEAQTANSKEMVMHSVEPRRILFEHKRPRISKLKRWLSRTSLKLTRGETSGLYNYNIPDPEAMTGRHQPSCRDDFQIALICALQVESDAVEALFDDYYEKDYSYGKAPGDPNAYTTGRMGGYDVVLAFMPGMGKVNSANVAAGFRASFPRIKLGLVVGICGGVPNGTDDEKEVLLGDVIISTALIQFDFGRQYENKAVRRDTLQDNLSRPNAEIRAFLGKLSGLRGCKILREKTYSYLEELWGKDGFEEFSYPGADNDILYPPSYHHKHHNTVCSICQGPHDQICDAARESSCAELRCQDSMAISRSRVDKAKGVTASGRTPTDKELREAQKPLIHFGMVVSGDSVMKSGRHRDEIASREKAIAFEMEGAGVWDNFPTVVIKGVCDYADSHKNKTWQKYAAATAAACMKAFLGEWRQPL